MNLLWTFKPWTTLTLGLVSFAPSIEAYPSSQSGRQQALRMVDVGHFLAQHGHNAEAKATFHQAFEVGDDSPEVVAAVLTGLRRLQRSGDLGVSSDIAMLQDLLNHLTGGK